jgi:hypothetical protein
VDFDCIYCSRLHFPGDHGRVWGPVGELPGSLSGVIFVDVDAEDMNVKERKGNAWTRKERNGK